MPSRFLAGLVRPPHFSPQPNPRRLFAHPGQLPLPNNCPIAVASRAGVSSLPTGIPTASSSTSFPSSSGALTRAVCFCQGLWCSSFRHDLHQSSCSNSRRRCPSRRLLSYSTSTPPSMLTQDRESSDGATQVRALPKSNQIKVHWSGRKSSRLLPFHLWIPLLVRGLNVWIMLFVHDKSVLTTRDYHTPLL